MKPVLRLRNLIWLLIPVLIWWALRDIPIDEVWQVVSSLTLYKILILIALNIIIVLLLTCRWWFILRAYGHKLSLFQLAGYRLASFSVSYFTPGTQFGGEPLQVHFTRDRHHVPAAISLAAVSVDKIFDLVTNFTFIAVGFLVFLTYGLSINTNLGFLLLILLIIPVIYMLALWAGWSPTTKLLTAISKFRPGNNTLIKTLRLVTSTERALSELFRHQPKIILWMIFFSGSIWLLLVAEYWLSLQFLGAPLNAGQTLLALTAARVAFLLPLPGGVGALEASQVWAMETLGLDPAIGASLVLMIRARDISLGIFGFWLAAHFVNRSSKSMPITQAANLVR